MLKAPSENGALGSHIRGTLPYERLFRRARGTGMNENLDDVSASPG